MSGERLSFRPKDERQLEQLSDDLLVAYIVEARDGGYDHELRTATSILVFRRYPQLLASIRKKVRSAEDAEDLLGETILDMLKAAFRGTFAGEFFSLFYVIRNSRIADYYKRADRDPEFETSHSDGPDLIEELLGSEEFTAESEVRMLIEECLAEYPERDATLIRMRIDGFPSKEVAAKVNRLGIAGQTEMTPANVDQIFARFKRRLRPGLFPDEGAG
jgi:RNA polymerase sigma factor (sigma-70 family)